MGHPAGGVLPCEKPVATRQAATGFISSPHGDSLRRGYAIERGHDAVSTVAANELVEPCVGGRIPFGGTLRAPFSQPAPILLGQLSQLEFAVSKPVPLLNAEPLGEPNVKFVDAANAGGSLRRQAVVAS
jgi:hypothetical protein